VTTAATTAIVVHFGRAETTARCLKALEGSEGTTVASVVVVDNGSVEPFTPVPGRRVRVIRTERNVGYGGAINLAMAALPPAGSGPDGRSILVLNNDVEIAPGCLRALEERAAVEALLAPVIWNRPGGAATDWGATINRATMYARDLAVMPADDTAVEFVTGAALFATERVFRAIGPWDERFFMYGEDVDYCLAARERGIGMRIIPAAVAFHEKGTASGRGLNRFNAYYIHRNRMLLARKWQTTGQYLVFVALYGLIMAGKLAKWSCLQPSLSRPLLAAFVDGLRGRGGQHPDLVAGVRLQYDHDVAPHCPQTPRT
jgi:N-acetylglucosaminyl-diphospho-decaprenol L-rhamnosyltransferase